MANNTCGNYVYPVGVHLPLLSRSHELMNYKVLSCLYIGTQLSVEIKYNNNNNSNGSGSKGKR